MIGESPSPLLDELKCCIETRFLKSGESLWVLKLKIGIRVRVKFLAHDAKTRQMSSRNITRAEA